MIEPADRTSTAAAEAVVALERTILEGAADEVESFDTGVLLRQPALPEAAVLNQFVADPCLVRALGTDALLVDLEAAFGPGGRLWVPDDELGRELEAPLAWAGLRARRDAVLVHAGSVADAAPDDEGGAASGVPRPDARRLEREVLTRDGLRPREVTRLLVLRDALSAAVEVDHIVAEGAAHAAVYAADGVAKIADVATLPRERRRGLASAAVEAAVGRAHAAGHEHVVAVVPARSWAVAAARRLGFGRAGGWWSFAPAC